MLELCVIFGGQSPEHEISRKSVTSVLNNLNKDKYNISTIGITKNGAWYLYTGEYAKIESGEWEQDTENKKKAILSPDADGPNLKVLFRLTYHLILRSAVLIQQRAKLSSLIAYSLFFTVKTERTEQFKVFLNFREYLMSVWV